jgi:hypothetical protein
MKLPWQRRVTFEESLWTGRSTEAFLPLLPDARRANVYLPSYDGRWEEKGPWNFPGAFYSTTQNTGSLAACGMYGGSGSGPSPGPRLVLWRPDADASEWIWRQPSNGEELVRLFEAMGNDEVMSYACDGNAHWDVEGVRAWSRGRAPILAWAETALRTTRDDGAAYARGDKDACDHAALRALLAYYAGPAERDLRRYSFFLAERRLPRGDEPLPDL